MGARRCDRVLRVCSGTSSWITELSEHEADRGEAEESKRVTGQVFKILGQPATTVEPSEGALDNPSFGQDNELSRLGPFNDFDFPFTADRRHGSGHFWALIAAIGDDFGDEGKPWTQFFQHQWSTVAILNVGGMNHGCKIQTERIDRDMAFFTLDLFAGVIAVRIDPRPPFSVLFTL